MLLNLFLQFCIKEKHIENKAKTKWYYNYRPKYIANAFTLAEILITLTIIGVIATLTIPALVQNTQDMQLRIAWKKTYGVLDQATRRLVMDEGGSLWKVCAAFDDDCIRNKYLKYLAYTKKCDYGQKGCWYDNFYYLRNDRKYDWWNEFDADSEAILTDGTLFDIHRIYYDCEATSTNPYRHMFCSYITVDVNGFKGPNTWGKDIYGVMVKDKNIIPEGSTQLGYVYPQDDDCIQGSTDYDNWGYSCAAKYLMQ